MDFGSGFGPLGGRIIIDTVHTDVELPEICYTMMDTPQFQRLRYIKQIGPSVLVYPTATHTRFEHSIGVSHLAGKYAKTLQRKQPELDIDAKDIQCLYMAGLCRDLGQGPLSHVWTHFMRRFIRPDYNHHLISSQMFQFLLEDNNLLPLPGLDELDTIFIKELILGAPLTGENYKGRPQSKHFLYQMLINHATEMTVDKFDSVLRDCKQLGIETSFDTDLIMNNSRVVVEEHEGSSSIPVIAYSRDVLDTLKQFISAQDEVYHTTCRRTVNCVILEMFIDVFLAADKHFGVYGSNGKRYTLSEAYTDLSAFTKLTDIALDQIYNWGNGSPRARRLIDDIVHRRFYMRVGLLPENVKDEVIASLERLDPCVKLMRCEPSWRKPAGEEVLNRVVFYGKHSHNPYGFKEVFTYVQRGGCLVYVVLRPNHATPEEEMLGAVDLESVKSRVVQFLEENNVILNIECKLNDNAPTYIGCAK